MKLSEGIAYIVAEVAGGIVGAYLLYAMMDTSPSTPEAASAWAPTGTAWPGTGCTSARGRLPHRGGADHGLRIGGALRHRQGGHRGRGRRSDRLRACGVHLIGIPLTGTSGWSRPLLARPSSWRPALRPGLFLSPAGGGAGGGHHPLAIRRQLHRRQGRDRRRLSGSARRVTPGGPAVSVRSMDLTEALTFVGARMQGVLITIRSNGLQLSNILYVPGDEGMPRSRSRTTGQDRNLRRDPRPRSTCRATASPVRHGRGGGRAHSGGGRSHDATVDALVAVYKTGNGEHPTGRLSEVHGRRQAAARRAAGRAPAGMIAPS